MACALRADPVESAPMLQVLTDYEHGEPDKRIETISFSQGEKIPLIFVRKYCTLWI